MDIADLALFVDVVESGSMSEAARRTGRSQSAVSRAIQRLEQELGVLLLRRSEAGVLEVLPAGMRLLETARDVVERERRLREDLARWSGQMQGPLRIAASTIPGEYLVPRLLAAFRERYPSVSVQVLVSDTAHAIARLMRREADLCFIGAVPEGQQLALEPVGEDEIVLVVPTGHPFATRPSVSFAEVATQPLVVREEGSGTLASLRRSLSAHGLDLPAERVTVVGSTHGQLAAIQAGVGIGFVSSWAAERTKGVTIVRIEGLEVRRTLYLAYVPDRLDLPAARRFVEFVRDLRRVA